MKVALVHSFYREELPSGENESVRSLASALESGGHTVKVFGRRTEEERLRGGYELRAAVTTATAWRPSPRKELESFGPDVIHVHNLFPNLGSTWVRQMDIPVVTTLHNFRPLCANGMLFRDGGVCTDCLDRSALSAVANKCYHDSRLATLPLAFRSSLGLARNPLLEGSKALICLSSKAAGIYEESGVPSEKLRVIPNGIDKASVRAEPAELNQEKWLYVGRLSAEKGISELLEEWPRSTALDIVGDGPLRESIRTPSSNVRFLGRLPRETIREMMPGYAGLIFPSLCLEMQPTVVVEALSVGLPVIALRGNAGADMVDEHGGGRAYVGGSLSTCLSAVAANRAELSEEAIQAFNLNYSVETWLARLDSLYTQLVRGAKSRN